MKYYSLPPVIQVSSFEEEMVSWGKATVGILRQLTLWRQQGTLKLAWGSTDGDSMLRDWYRYFGQKSQYCVIWGIIIRILTNYLLEMIPNVIKIPNFTLEMYLLWYWESYIDLEVGVYAYL